MVGGLLVAALPAVEDADAGQRVGLGGTVIAVAGGAQRMGVDGQAFGDAGIEVTADRGGQPGGVAGPAVAGGVDGDRDQGGQLGIQPDPGGCQVSELGHGRGRARAR